MIFTQQKIASSWVRQRQATNCAENIGSIKTIRPDFYAITTAFSLYIAAWYNTTHGQISFHLPSMLNGHGCSRHFNTNLEGAEESFLQQRQGKYGKTYIFEMQLRNEVPKDTRALTESINYIIKILKLMKIAKNRKRDEMQILQA